MKPQRTIEDINEALITSRESRQYESWRLISQKLASGELLKIRKGIYIESQKWQSLKPWEQQTARILALARQMPDVVLSHTSAAQLFGFVTPNETLVHIYSDGTSRSRIQSVAKHCLLTQDTSTVLLELGIRVTCPLTTVLDCARYLPIKQGVALADSALFQRAVETEELAEKLTEAQGRNCRKMRQIARLVSPKSESAGESYTRMLLDEMGLVYEEQKEFFLAGSHYRYDFALEDFGIIVEFDGRLKLTDFGAPDAVLEQERYREKALRNAGWVVFRADWDLVTRRPAEFKRQLSQLIHRSTGFAPRYS